MINLVLKLTSLRLHIIYIEKKLITKQVLLSLLQLMYQLGDFGLARTQQEDSDHSSETRVVRTLGYVAPEYAESGKAYKRTDVYSFGVVLLQLITGLETTDKELKGKSLVEWLTTM